MRRLFSTFLMILCLRHQVMSTPLDGMATFKTSSSGNPNTILGTSSKRPSLSTTTPRSSSTISLSNGELSTATQTTSKRLTSSLKSSSKPSPEASSRTSSNASSGISSRTPMKPTSGTSTKISSTKTTSTKSSGSSAVATSASPPASTLDDYVALTSAQKQQIAFDVSINFATQLAIWDFQACVRNTLGWSCELSYQQRTLDRITQEFRPIGNYDTFAYDVYTQSQYYGLQASDISNTTFVSHVTNALLMGCLGNITCQVEFAKRPNVYMRVATDLVRRNVEQIATELSSDKAWIPTGYNAKYLQRFAAYPDYTGEMFGVHSAIPLAILARYLDQIAFGTLLQMNRIMIGHPQCIEDSINTVALLGLQVPDWSNINNSVLGNIYNSDKALLNKRTEVDWFNVDPTKLLRQMDATQELEKRDSGLDQIKAICSSIGLATSFMSIRGIVKNIATKIRPRPTIATFENAFGAYDSSENLVLSTITDVCSQPSSACYGGSHFWQYTSVAGDAIDIVAGYIGLAAAATAIVGLSGGAAVVGGAEIALNTLNLGCALAIFAVDVARAVMTDCQNDPTLPQCASLSRGCLSTGSIKSALGVA